MIKNIPLFRRRNSLRDKVNSSYHIGWVLVLILVFRSFNTMAQETCMLVPAPLSERVTQATLITEGQVIKQQSFWDQQHQNIYTANLIQVYKIFKGNLTPASTLQIITEGGSVGNDLHRFSGTLALAVGQQGIFFLEQNKFPVPSQYAGTGGVYSAYSSLQGFIRYNLPFEEASDPFAFYQSISTELYPLLKSFRQISVKIVQPNPELEKAIPRKTTRTNPAARTMATPIISGLAPEIIASGTGAILSISGQNFGTAQGLGFVEFRNANDGGATFIKPQAGDYILWRDDLIQVRVPSNTTVGGAGSGQIRVTNNELNTITSDNSLVVLYAASTVLKDDNAYNAYHINANGEGGYTFQFANSVSVAAQQTFKRAMLTWTCQTAINWQTNPEISTLNVAAEDNINIIRFIPSSQLPTNVLGRTISRYKGCQIQNDFRYWVDEIDMEFNNSINWQFGPETPSRQFDFETVALHELGHAHQLSHINYPGAVMHYAVTRNQVNRKLSGQSDIDGGNFIISRSFQNNVCGATPMAPMIATNCVNPDSLLVFEATIQNNNTTLTNWQVNNNQGLTYFDLERSSNAINWFPVVRIPVGQNTRYEAPDLKPYPGFTYYRLRLVRNSNAYDYSPVRRTGTETEATANILLYPNPIRDNRLYYEYQAPAAGILYLRIYDTAGRTQATVARKVAKGTNPFFFDVSNLSKGFYLIQSILNQEVRTLKFIKL